MASAGDEQVRSGRSALAALLGRRCPRCREGAMFASLWRMNENCPRCGLDFDRGDPGYFTGAMYVSYAIAIPLIGLVSLVENRFAPDWSFARLVGTASLFCVPTIPWIWQYSRVLWCWFDRGVDPNE